MNNLKEIREIYGATQEQIASAINVNRVTVANWEAGKTAPSGSNRERLSLYYGIDAEFFFEEKLTDAIRKRIQITAQRAQTLAADSKGTQNKDEDFHNIFEKLQFPHLLKIYVFAAKIMMAKAEEADLQALKNAKDISDKLGKRLDMYISLLEEEQRSGGPSFADLVRDLKFN